MTSQHRENIEECEKIFVPWVWLVGILVVLLMAIGGLSWAGGVKVTKNDTVLVDHETRISRLEKVEHTLDTLKNQNQVQARQNERLLELLTKLEAKQ